MVFIRSFIAINLSSEIEKNLGEVSSKLKERLPDVPVRWVPTPNIHLTIKFLGDVSVSNIEVLKKILKSEAGRHAPFVFSVGHLGAYPSMSRPRVIWVGVEAPAEMHALQRGIDIETARLGYAREKRKFSPHLTLGRVSRGAGSGDINNIRDVLNNCKVGFLGAARVSGVHLYQSELRPNGAEYSRLFTASLALVET
jgi:2'-5' RNA ligase